jgi:hypothetical protein
MTGPIAGVAPGTRGYALRLDQVTSLLLYTSRKGISVTGTYPEVEAAYRRVLIHNLLLGWWGFPFGLIWTPMAMLRNRRALMRLRRQTMSSPASAPR